MIQTRTYNRMRSFALRAERSDTDTIEASAEVCFKKKILNIGSCVIGKAPFSVSNQLEKISLGNKELGRGAESIVLVPDKSGIVTKITGIGSHNTIEDRAERMRTDLALVDTYFEGMVAHTEVVGIRERFGLISGPFVVSKQAYVEGVPLVHSVSRGDLEYASISSFVDSWHRMHTETGRMVDLINPDNVLATKKGIQIVDTSLLTLVEGDPRQIAHEYETGIINESIDVFSEYAAALTS